MNAMAERHHRFSNILFVALETGSEPPTALTDAIDFAHLHDAKFMLYDVVPQAPRHRRSLSVGESTDGINELAAAVVEAELAEWLEPFADLLSADTAVDIGRRPLEVVQRVRRDQHDLVIVAPDGSADNLSTVRRLIRVCPCPVLILRSQLLSGNVVAAVDPDDRLDLNVTILNVAITETVDSGGKLHVVHAFQSYDSDRMLASELAPFGATEFARFTDRVKQSHRDTLTELLDRVGVWVPHETHLVTGQPSPAIAQAAEQLDVSLIVVGSAGRHDMEALLIGNTAERLVAATTCSLLVVKPRDFEPALAISVDRSSESHSSIGATR